MISTNESITMNHAFTWPEREDEDDEDDDEDDEDEYDDEDDGGGGRRIGAAFLSTCVIMLETREEMIAEGNDVIITPLDVCVLKIGDRWFG